MAKLLDKNAYRVSFANSCDNDYADIPNVTVDTPALDWDYVICEEAVRVALKTLQVPDAINVKVYSKNPKRKGTIHVKRAGHGIVGWHRVEWCGRNTLIYDILDDAADDFDEFWVVVTEIS